MTRRRDAAAARRKQLHITRIAAADTPSKRFWKTCAWLISEALLAGRVDEVTAQLRDLIDTLRAENPRPRTRTTATTIVPPPAGVPGTPVTDAPGVPWYDIARGRTTPTSDNRTEPTG